MELCRIVKYIKLVMNMLLFLTCAHTYEIIDVVPDLAEYCWLFLGTVQTRFFKLCIITLRWVYQFVPGLMTLILLQGHRCVRIINCI